MLSLPPSVRLFIACEPTDMRKSFDGLAGLVRGALEQDALSGHLYIFFNKPRNRVKVLWWDRTGYCIFAKRLEAGQFYWRAASSDSSGRTATITAAELQMILEGIDLSKSRRHTRCTRENTGISAQFSCSCHSSGYHESIA